MLAFHAVFRFLFSALAAFATLLALAHPAYAGPNDGLPKTNATLDRSTPRRAMAGFIDAAHAGDYERAANYLDLRSIPRFRQASEGPELARKLAYVLDRKVDVDLDRLPDEPEAREAIAGTAIVEDEPVNVSLARIKFPDGVPRWVIARSSVAMIPPLYAAFGPSEWADRFPPILVRVAFLGNALWQWLALVLLAVGGYLGARALAALLIALAQRFAQRTKTTSDNALVETARRPLRGVLFVLIVRQMLPELHLTAAAEDAVHHVAYTLLVIAVTWFVLRAISIGAEWAEERLPSGSQLELKHRAVQTQLELLRRVMSVVIVIIAIAVGLMQFEFVRNVGVSLLASAGVAGIALGVAAQKSLAGIIAGIQLSLSQPIRIGDSVVVEKEMGHIEEINLTYVVVRLWDERRLVVPMTRFLEQPFENWSRNSTEILGTVFLHVDFATPIDRLRVELRRICEGSPNWDQRLCLLQVTDSTDRRMVLRCLVSAASASRAFDLRCEIREALIDFLRQLDGGRYHGNPRLDVQLSPPKADHEEPREATLPLPQV
ncbi:mechanosensitive ion channel family protein [Pendulispora albinea]|uniref:Mechanosensitive ion channel family protein n=1 Tax=Pendulispora albinea TaxID=2741071 RepID=A0ABZ2LQ50_9BACT